MSEEPSWIESLPEPLREAPWIAKAESPEAAFKELQNAAQYQGQSLRIPSEEAGEADIAAFHQKLVEKVPGLIPVPKADDMDATRAALRALGMPEKPEQYSVEGIDHAPEGEDLGRLRTMAHEAGMTAAQFRKWISEQSSASYTAREQMEFQRDEALKELKGEWGAAYDTKIANALKAAEETGAPDYVLDMVKQGQMDAKSLRWLDSVYEQLGSDTPAQGTTQGKESAPAMTRAEAEARLGEVERRLFDRATPADQKPMLTEKRLKLIAELVNN